MKKNLRMNPKKNLLKSQIQQNIICQENTQREDINYTSAPNHSCPAKFSCRTSSGNLTLKSLDAL